jgi:thiol-disulfide isomerase/thioredoxin
MAIVLASAALIVALVAVAVALASAARLRAATMEGTLGAASSARAPLPELNLEITDFTARRVDGGSFSNADLAADGQLIGFFASNCSSCKHELPHFLAAVERIPHDGPRPVAVLSGIDEEVAEMAELFPGQVSVVVEPDLAFSRSAGVEAYPTFLVADHGKVKTSAVRMDRLFAHR